MTAVDAAFVEALRLEFGERFVDRRAEVDGVLASTPGKRRLARPGGTGAILGYCVHHIGPGVDYGEWSIVDAWRYAVKSAPWVDAAGVVRRGWDTGNYMAGIRPDGTLELAALPSHTTYHAGGARNDAWTGVVILHDCRRGVAKGGPPTDAELDALYRWLLVSDRVIGPRPWRGHCEIRSTVCPGPVVMTHLRRMRGPLFGAAAFPPRTYSPAGVPAPA